MKKVTIYTTNVCPFCVRAKALLKKKSVDFKEIDVSDEDARADMMKKTGGARSVPQIFIGEEHIGGCDDLYALDKDNKLDAKLK